MIAILHEDKSYVAIHSLNHYESTKNALVLFSVDLAKHSKAQGKSWSNASMLDQTRLTEFLETIRKKI